jgi:putative membrane-bound dehydrogenase-like protein
MPRLFALLLTLLVLVPSARSAEKKPIKALLVTGGCCHDYERQKRILTKGIAARANVEWTVVLQGGKTTDTKIPLYKDEGWADGFDVIVHNECFANVRDPKWLDRVLKPHRNGTPAILIHCAMHCYRTGGDEWFKFVGMQSPGHGPHYGYDVVNMQPDHPIMAGFGKSWPVAKGELYHSAKLFPTARSLAAAKRKSDGQPQTCVWTNQYGKTRVFATTIGHYNETMAEPKYLDMLTRGLLWSVDRLEKDEFTPADEKTNAAIKALVAMKLATPSATGNPSGKCCGDGNLAAGKPTKASSQETGKKNFAVGAVDGNLGTRWCAQGARSGEWWQVDLGAPKHVKSLRIHWEKSNAAYRYKIEGSADGKTWKDLIDRSKNKKIVKITPHDVDAADTRFVRVTFLGSSTGVWGSFWEFEAYEGKLPELPKAVANAAAASATIADVTAPPGFAVTLFAQPPLVNYPVCLTAAATGEVFVGIDEQGSLGKQKGRGRIVRCRDIDGDGVADEVKTFAKVDHPRGLIYDDGSLWVLHPPTLTVFHDDNRDGKADRSDVLVTGLSTDQVAKRGADHTTNGIRMGIDGWIYIAVGDFGFVNAKGTDGRTLTKRGGGVLRVQPDGTDMEVYSWGQRNILDACINPYLDIFTRDNTNDGGGWDIRLSHVIQSANYGYPSLYKNFAEEIMPPLKDYGGGSGCGGMYLHDLRWPTGYGDTLYTCDWGRSEVYRHVLPKVAPTFAAHQDVFLKIPRPTDIDVDARGLMYVSSWKGGKFNFAGPNIGFVAQVRPVDFTPKPFPNLNAASDTEVVAELKSPSASHRLHAQRELLRRGRDETRTEAITSLANDDATAKFARVAAIFTLKQLDEGDSHATLIELTKNQAVGEFALRALTDRRAELKTVLVEPFIKALGSKNLRTRAQALISLGRLGDATSGTNILSLTQRVADSKLPTGPKVHAQPDPGRVIPHLAVQALVDIKAVRACLKGLEGPHFNGAIAALRKMHEPAVVEGLIARLGRESNPIRRSELFTALIRLYHQEGAYKGDWWGTRPDTTGPYYDRQKWEKSDRIAVVLKTASGDAPASVAKQIAAQLDRHRVQIEGIASIASTTRKPVDDKPIVIPKFDSKNPKQIGNIDKAVVTKNVLAIEGNIARGKMLFTRQSCIACHTYADGQTPKGPHLVDIGKRSKPIELVESVLLPSRKIAQGFDTYTFVTDEGKQIIGFVTRESAQSISVRQTNGTSVELDKKTIDARVKQDISMMPKELVHNLTVDELADLLAYLRSLNSGG